MMADGHEHRFSLSFSRIEILHLAGSVLALTVGFAFVLNDAGDPAKLFPRQRFDVPISLYVASFVAVASGFVLHEMAHKAVAQYYHHWAEFRGYFQGLIMSLLIAAGIGILIAAPGAVNIWGRVGPKQNGLISLAGPGTNFAIASLTFPVAYFLDVTTPVPNGFAVVASVNAILCLFNLLPIGNLDGRKVLRWSKLVFAASLLAAMGLVALTIVSGVSPMWR